MPDLDQAQRVEAVLLFADVSGFTALGDKTTLIDTYKLLAEVELELNDVDAALEHCQRSLEIAQEIGSREYEGIAYRVLGHIHRVSGSAEAAKHLQNSVETLLATESKLELGKSYYELGLALQATGEPGAREYLKRALHIFQDLSVEVELEKARAALDSDRR
jgi:tetratricopeptide (TPR) repeat protein